MRQYRVELEIVEIEEPVSVSDAEVGENRFPTKGYHLFLQTRVGDKLIELVLDTGASKSVFDPELIAEHIEHPEETPQIKSSGVNADIEMGFGYIKKIAFGSYIVEKMPVGFTALDHVNQMYSAVTNKQIGGLLGSDFLVQHDAVIDYRGRTLDFWA